MEGVQYHQQNRIQHKTTMEAVSLEALAMADVNHLSLGIDVKEWERRDLDQSPPPHLLAEDEEEVVLNNDKEEENNIDERHLTKKILQVSSQSRVSSRDMEKILDVWVHKVIVHARNYKAIYPLRKDNCHLRSDGTKSFKDLSCYHSGELRRKSDTISEFRR